MIAFVTGKSGIRVSRLEDFNQTSNMALPGIFVGHVPCSPAQPGQVYWISQSSNEGVSQPLGRWRLRVGQFSRFSLSQPVWDSSRREANCRQPNAASFDSYQAERFRPDARKRQHIRVSQKINSALTIHPAVKPGWHVPALG
jgi:hypothetical protein